MPKPDNNNTDTVIADENKNSDKNLNKDVDLNNANGDTDKQTVPLATFLKLKDEIKTYKDELQKIADNNKKADEEKLKAQGDLQKLLDAKEDEIKTLKPDAEAYKVLRQSEIEDAKKVLGDKWLDEYANLSLTALRKLVKTLSPLPDPAKVDTSNPDKKEKVVLTEAQKAEAKIMGLSDEAYIEIQEKRKANKK